MIDPSKRSQKEQDRERTRRRMHTQVDPENYEYIPEKKRVDYYDNDAPMRVAIYVRVSTDDVRQTTSYEYIYFQSLFEDLVRDTLSKSLDLLQNHPYHLTDYPF